MYKFAQVDAKGPGTRDTHRGDTREWSAAAARQDRLVRVTGLARASSHTGVVDAVGSVVKDTRPRILFGDPRVRTFMVGAVSDTKFAQTGKVGRSLGVGESTLHAKTEPGKTLVRRSKPTVTDPEAERDERLAAPPLPEVASAAGAPLSHRPPRASASTCGRTARASSNPAAAARSSSSRDRFSAPGTLRSTASERW